MRSLFVLVVYSLIFLWQTCSIANRGDSKGQDVSRSKAAASSQRFGPSFSAFTSGNFNIVHDANETEAETIAQLLEVTYQQFQSTFQGLGFELRNPEDKLVWVCFSDCDRFNRYALEADGMDLSWLSGYYSAKTNVVAIIKPHAVAYLQEKHSPARDGESSGNILAITSVPGKNPDVVKIMHEAAHQFAFNTGLQKRRVMYPLWFSEGLATSFENGQAFTNDNVRMRHLVEMYHQGRLIPLAEFITMTRLPVDGGLHKDIYAQAYGLFNFLRKEHSGELKNYLTELYKLEPGWRNAQRLQWEFVSAFGPADELEGAWLRFIQTSRGTEQ